MLAYITLLPEFVLLSGVLLLLVSRILNPSITPRFVYGVCKITLISATLLTIVFYNRSLDGYFVNNGYTGLFKLIVYLLSIFWSYLSLKHFYIKDKNAFRFYVFLLLEVLSCSIIISSRNVILLSAGLSLSLLVGYLLLFLDTPSEEKNYPCWIMLSFFILLLFVSSCILYEYLGVSDYLPLKALPETDLSLNFVFIATMLSLFFAIGLAPLHLCSVESIEKANLPAAGYMSLVPVFAYISAFITLVSGPFSVFYVWFSDLVVAFGIISIIFGALGVNSSESLRKTFAYAGVYYIGVVVLCLSQMSERSILSALVYLLTYIISMFGIYTSFYALKYKGEYVEKLEQIKSLASERPFLASSMLIFMISMIGLPPLFGFVGQLYLFDYIAHIEAYKIMVVIMLSLLVISYGYLKVISAIYFEAGVNKFDTVDRVVYFSLSVNIFIILILAFRPQYLINSFGELLAGGLY